MTPESPGESSPAPGTEPAPGLSPEDLLAVLPRLTRLSSAFNKGRLVERAAEAAGPHLDRPAVGVLVTLLAAGEPLRIGEIADRMQVVGPHVTRQVQNLEKHRLVRRVTDPLDRRASLVEPTEAGDEAAHRYVATLLGWFAEVLADWPRQDREDLLRLLARFADDVAARLAAPEEEAGNMP
ncbi:MULTISPECIES: MarR family winged helix-turn-helix transcriptional regulator [Streptomyces]|jgi:DNA-binding MarR family transcriptional regulator|uniref:Transcriptional regulator, MarR family n=1 Tax=Streptomyces griseoaurantiacus TaxID=68213 RepID=A0A1G7D4M1_9ACTN|nr:MarR family winged helix-turn-helix transcriptional regulator [Streptomyces jietaisiensis]SDE45970.1 transcriptional regulator, MarR family [Streptomyces jietaisiensis]